MLRTILISTFLSMPLLGITQDIKLCPQSESKKAKKLFDEATGMIKDRSDYNKTKAVFLDCLQEDSTYAAALLAFGNLAFSKKDWVTMKDCYRRFIRLCPDGDMIAHYRLGVYLYDTKKPEESMPYLKSFLEFAQEKEDLNRTAETYLFRAKLMTNPVPFNPEPVKGVSTSNPEYLAAISPDNEMFFFTRRFDEAKKGSLTPTSVEKLMLALRNSSGSFDKGAPMPSPFNSSNNNNEGGPSINKDNNFIVFTRNINGNFDLCYSQKSGDSWSDINNMGSNVNDPKQWDAQPTLSSDNKTIYFTTYRDSVYGTSDIYMTTRSDGSFSKATRMSFNTYGNEKSPFMHPDNATFYFSSDSLPGMGGFDIFMIKKDASGKWGKPVNLGYPINTESDEVGFFVSTDGKTGYFSSNKLSSTGGYDIYSFEIPADKRPEKVLFVKGKIGSESDSIPSSAKIELKNINTSEIINVEYDTITGHYSSVVKLDSDYILTVKGEGTAYNSHYLEVADTAAGKIMTTDVKVEKLQVGAAYNLNDILFETNSAELNNRTSSIVKDFASYLKDNKSLKVAIHGHTDNAGDANKNMELSQARAKAVYDLLVSEGLDSKKLSYQGFGQTKPVADNSTAEGKAKNRRTEFVVTSK